MALLLNGGIFSLTAAAISFVVSLVFNFFAHAAFTFQASISVGTAFRYGCVVVLNLSLSLLCVWVLERAVGSPVAGKIISLVFVAANSYWLGRVWIYR